MISPTASPRRPIGSSFKTVTFDRRNACPSLAVPMRTGDGFLARLPPLARALKPEQLGAIAAAAQAHGNGLVEISKRGNLQLRGLASPDTTRLAADLAKSEPNGAIAYAISSGNTSSGLPGLTIHISVVPIISSRPKNAIHGLRRPAASATAPNTGDSSAMTRPAAAAV